MQHETDLIALQNRRKRIMRLLLAIPWLALVLALALTLWPAPG